MCGENDKLRGVWSHRTHEGTNSVYHQGVWPFVLLFDESLNKKSQAKQMDIHTRFWDNEQVTIRYMESVFMGEFLDLFLQDFFIIWLGWGWNVLIIIQGMSWINFNLSIDRESHAQGNVNINCLNACSDLKYCTIEVWDLLNNFISHLWLYYRVN